MNKRIAISAAGIAALAAVAIAPAAHAGITIAPGTVTSGEYAAAGVGETKHDVQASFGTRGNLLSLTPTTRWKVYQGDGGGHVVVTYQLGADGHYRMSEKVWLP